MKEKDENKLEKKNSPIHSYEGKNGASNSAHNLTSFKNSSDFILITKGKGCSKQFNKINIKHSNNKCDEINDSNNLKYNFSEASVIE